MSDDELFDAIDGLFAYDTGCTDSGIRDERLRARVKAELSADLVGHPHSTVGPRLTAAARRYIEPPYGLEDVKSFIEWLSEFMDIDV